MTQNKNKKQNKRNIADANNRSCWDQHQGEMQRTPTTNRYMM